MFSNPMNRRFHMGSRGKRGLVVALATLSIVLGILAPAHAAQLTLTWSDTSTNENGFKVERKTGTVGAYGQIATVAAETTGYVDAAVTAGATYCYRVRAYNSAGDSAYSNEACAAPAGATLYTVGVTKTGTGSGTVTSAPSGVTCGTTCSGDFDYGTNITLTATPATGSSFTSWSGADCSGTGACTFPVSVATTVKATFTLKTNALTLTKSGTGTGTVMSNPSGVNCGSDCTEEYSYNTVVTLTAAPTDGSTFTGWGGACTGTGTCNVSMTTARSVTASFTNRTVTTYQLTVTRTGAGTISSTSAGIDCGSTCSASFPSGTTVSLAATAPAGSNFTGWGGACSGTGACTVNMTAERNVTATFATTTALAVTSVTANRTAPQPAGTAVTFTANVRGGVTPYEYKWWVWDGRAWSVARPWGTGNTVTWTPPAAGSYGVYVWVRNNGTTVDTYEAWGQMAYEVR